MSINIQNGLHATCRAVWEPCAVYQLADPADTIPKDWYCYDLRGTRQSPNVKISLVDKNRQVSCRHGTLPHPPQAEGNGFTSGQQCVPPVGRGNDTGTVL